MASPYPNKENPQQFSEHGTRQAYDKSFCRCPECRAWKKAENAKKRKTQKLKREEERKAAWIRNKRLSRGEDPEDPHIRRRPSGKLTAAQEEIERVARARAGDRDED